MTRLIDADALHTLFDEKCAGECESCTYYEDCKDHRYCGLIDLVPIIEERPQGKWITTWERGIFQCSCCHGMSVKCNFCPNCGADMRGDKE